MDGFLLGELTAGFSRGVGVFSPLLMGLLRITVPFYHSAHHKIVEDCRKERFPEEYSGAPEEDKKEN